MIARSFLRLFIFLLAVSGAVTIYFVIVQRDDRYNVFDFFKGTPISGTIGQASPLTAPKKAGPEPDAIPPEFPKSDGMTPVGDETPSAGKPLLDTGDLDLLERINNSLATVTEAVIPSVVSIDTTKTVNVREYVPTDPFGFFGYYRNSQRRGQPGLGSGVFISEDGYIITNHHVVAGVDEIQVTTHTGERFEAEWVGSDPNMDVAVLKINGGEARRFPALSFGNSDAVRAGEMVLAIGNPFGLNETVTRGIISNRQRRLSDAENEYFQTDTVINPGNSGGPLVNIRGEVIGINVALFAGQQDVRVWQGVGLAIPSNGVKEVFEAIVHDQALIRGYLGFELGKLDYYLARTLGLKSLKGALVMDVAKDSPAAAAGLQQGDVIVKINERPISSPEDAIRRVRGMKAGTAAEIGIIRNGTPEILTASVIERPDEAALTMRKDIEASGQAMVKALGLKVRDLSPAERDSLGLGEHLSAIIITDVEPGSQAAERILPGDLIHQINRDPIFSTADFYEVLGELPKDQVSIIVLTRRGQRYALTLSPGA